MADINPNLISALIKAGLIETAEDATFEALTGGVSSDIWKIITPERVFCVKQALSKLKVEADWYAPVERNEFEVAWYSIASDLVPGAAPAILMQDKVGMMFAMDFLDTNTHKLWKSELRDGRVDIQAAEQVGALLAKVHSGTVGDAAVAKQFPYTGIFHAIRLEPYLEATANKHPDLKDQLLGLSKRTADTKLCMIHGDVSPKNILLGPNGPVFLDAECACMGDPAFDLAFCLNHFLLKCLWMPASTPEFLLSYDAMVKSYLVGVDWEAPNDLEARAASLLPGLFLGRVDGKSPVEYITDEDNKNKVRRCARASLGTPPTKLSDVRATWKKELMT
jgi:aminoglycoside phosphotransferase (APT) family kinase protein